MRLVVLLCTVLLLVGACDSKGGSMSSKDEQFAELAKRPDIEQIHDEYPKMLQQIRDELVAKIGIAAWIPKDEPFSGAGCSDFPNIGGETRSYSSGRSPGNLPDAKWADAVKLVESIAGQHGFKLHGAVIDKPSDHEVTFGNDWGAELLFGTAKNTTLSVNSGCHLPRAAKERGTPG